jgi:hypothetical protein
MRPFLLGLLALGLLAGATKAPVAPTVRAATESTAQRGPKTGLDNPYGVAVTSEARGSVALYITYEDLSGYFGDGSQPINAYVRVRTRSGGEQVFNPVPLTIYRGHPALRTGTVQLAAAGPNGVTTKEAVRSVELAFTSNGKWDSNHGKNYTVRL